MACHYRSISGLFLKNLKMCNPEQLPTHMIYLRLSKSWPFN